METAGARSGFLPPSDIADAVAYLASDVHSRSRVGA
jgi:hypothetical protein